MKPLKVLIFSGGALYPVNGMHQVRIINQIKALSKENDIHLCFVTTNKQAQNQTIQQLSSYCTKIIHLKTITQSLLYRILAKLFIRRFFSLLAWPHDHFVLSNPVSARQIAGTIERENYDIIISHYWQSSGFLRYLKGKYLKGIDTHYLVEENLELYKQGKYIHIDDGNLGKLLHNEFLLQHKYFDIVDFLIVNSEHQKIILENSGFSKVVFYIPNGQSLDELICLPIPERLENHYLLFYGSLSNQFNQRALRRIVDKIFPMIKSKDARIKLIVMGADPPEWIKRESIRNSAIIVTGYVPDIRIYLQQCFACLIPLESGSGFRGRVVELMAAGIPVVGTFNALRSIGITHGMDGFIAESDEELCHYVLQLASDDTLRINMAKASRAYAIEHFSLEGTHGQLNNLLNKLLFNRE